MSLFNNFFNAFLALSASDKIEVIGIGASFILSAIAIIISVLTLRQNSKMIEESTRPYITIYSNVTDFQNLVYYLVLKNFGQSGAEITSFKCNQDLSKYCYDDVKFARVPFKNIEGTFLTPGQMFKYPIDSTKLKDAEPLKFEISYKSSTHTYIEKITVNCAADLGVLHLRASTQGKELKAISYALQDIGERFL